MWAKRCKLDLAGEETANASAHTPQHAGWQGSTIEGEIEAEMARPIVEQPRASAIIEDPSLKLGGVHLLVKRSGRINDNSL